MPALIPIVTKYDTIAFRWCMSRKRVAEIASVSRRISSLGDGYLYALIGVLLFWLDNQYGSGFFYTGLLAFAIELPAYLLCKNLVRRNRPNDSIAGFEAFLVPSDKFSFPSGHTAAAFIMAEVITVYYPEFSVLSYSLALMIGCSRVLVGVHYPTDILAGMVLGMSSSSLAVSIMAAT